MAGVNMVYGVRVACPCGVVADQDVWCIPGVQLAWSMASIRHQPSKELVATLCSAAQVGALWTRLGLLSCCLFGQRVKQPCPVRASAWLARSSAPATSSS